MLDKIRDTTSFLSPGQVPVIAADQPIYALAINIYCHWIEQWALWWRQVQYVIFVWRARPTHWAGYPKVNRKYTPEQWVDRNAWWGWIGLHRSCQHHQNMVDASGNSMQFLQTYEGCLHWLPCRLKLSWSRQLWRLMWERKLSSPQFQFWNMVLSMELVIFLLIRSFREADFALYYQALLELILFFYHCKQQCELWLLIHLRYMLTLENWIENILLMQR